MRPRDKKRAKDLEERLIAHAANVKSLPGIEDSAARNAFVEQLVESIRRTEFLASLSHRPNSPRRAEPGSAIFDPLRAAVLHRDAGRIDEAMWLMFLAVTFGRHRRHGWALSRALYGRLGKSPLWDWEHAASHPEKVRTWVEKHAEKLHGLGWFGNHRKREALSGANGAGAVIESYIHFINSNGGHEHLFAKARAETSDDPRRTFDILYQQLSSVRRFGRTAKFDYLTFMANLRLAPVEPGKLYLEGATGPLKGANLVFGGSVQSSIPRATLEKQAADLAKSLSIPMNVLEDALCNWQKTPDKFVPYRG